MGDMGWIEQPKELEKEIAQMLDKVMNTLANKHRYGTMKQKLSFMEAPTI